MLNFIFCDDDARHNASMEKRIQRINLELGIESENLYFSTDPEDIINYSNIHSQESNVYILDIDFHGTMNGVELAKHIRKNEPSAYIIYVSAHQEYSLICYKTKTFDFLLKPIQTEILRECISNLYHDYKSVKEHLCPKIIVKSGAIVHLISIEDIIYCEKMGNLTIFHTANGTISSYNSLKDIQKKVEQHNFYRCHKSFLINLMYVDSVNVEKKIVKMTNGQQCDISRSTKKALLNYLNVK